MEFAFRGVLAPEAQANIIKYASKIRTSHIAYALKTGTGVDALVAATGHKTMPKGPLRDNYSSVLDPDLGTVDMI